MTMLLRFRIAAKKGTNGIGFLTREFGIFSKTVKATVNWDNGPFVQWAG